MGQLQNVHEELEKLGYQVIAISPDKPEKVKELSAKSPHNYLLLSDSKMEAAKSLGVAFRVGDDMLQALKGYNIDIEAASGETHHLLPVPSVLITDKAGKIKFEWVDPDYRVRPDPELVLAAAKSVLKK